MLVAALGVLDEQPARLELDVLPVGIGQQVFPDAAGAGQRPQPEFLPGDLLVGRPVTEAVTGIAEVAPEKDVVSFEYPN